MLSLIKLWLPSAASILLLSIELSLIAFLMLGKPLDIIDNYTVAIAHLMFANAIIYPISPFVVKNGNNPNSLKWSGVIVFSIFLLLNIYLFIFIKDSNVREVSHLFSISLIFIGLKRYLQACLIVHKYTVPIYWTVIFTLSSISIYPLLDIDSILLKVKQENEDILFRFSMVTSIISSVFAALLLFTLSVVIEEESIIKFIYTPSVFISFLVTPLLWNIRSMMRVENILSKRNKITIMSILSAFVLSFYLGGMLDILPVMLFNLIILVEIFIYFIFNLFKRF